ncbi:MAG: hypothetical protein U9Q16_01510 [Patescibacteria group bacterium]|nr:hypothetical protein [Patescibacteria group bacterium]
MAFEISNPIVYEKKENAQSKSIIDKIKKDSVFLVLLLAVIGGVLFLQNYSLIQDTTGSIFTKLQATVSPQSSLFEGYELDMPEVNLENLLSKTAIQETGQIENATEQQRITFEPLKVLPEMPSLALPEIEAKVFEIQKETETLTQEVNQLLLLAEIQKEIDSIGQGVDNLSREVQGSQGLTGLLCLK